MAPRRFPPPWSVEDIGAANGKPRELRSPHRVRVLFDLPGKRQSLAARPPFLEDPCSMLFLPKENRQEMIVDCRKLGCILVRICIFGSLELTTFARYRTALQVIRLARTRGGFDSRLLSASPRQQREMPDLLNSPL